jgi:predicted GIY-YIG superfamily endonuclease
MKNRIYVYGLLDKNDNIIYVGKSSTPKRRLISHDHASKLKILDVIGDIEIYWIQKLLKEGHNLANKHTNYEIEDWNVGDIIELGTKGIKIYDSQTQKTYDTIASLSKELNISYLTLQYRIENCNKSKFNEYKRYTLL